MACCYKESYLPVQIYNDLFACQARSNCREGLFAPHTSLPYPQSLLQASIGPVIWSMRGRVTARRALRQDATAAGSCGEAVCRQEMDHCAGYKNKENVYTDNRDRAAGSSEMAWIHETVGFGMWNNLYRNSNCQIWCNEHSIRPLQPFILKPSNVLWWHICRGPCDAKCLHQK